MFSNNKNNNFDLLRLILASVVLLYHAAVLSANATLAFVVKSDCALIAVQGFFVISGYLVFMSFENSKTLKEYFFKRVRRVYPGYFTVILFFSVLGLFFSTWPLDKYFGYEYFKYILSNLFFMNHLHPSLPGLFDGNPIHAVNGALWTIKVEVMFYLSVPVIVFLFKKYEKIFVMSLIYIFSVVYCAGIIWFADSHHRPDFKQLSWQLPGQLSYFMVGAAAYYYSESYKKYVHVIAFCSMFVFAVAQLYSLSLFEPISLGILVIYAACFIPYLGNFSKYGDLSYGVYIYHFPILQIFVSLGLFVLNPFISLGFSTIVVFVFAFLSWHLIEKPSLYKSSHYVKASSDR